MEPSQEETFIELPKEEPVFQKIHYEYFDKVLSAKLTCPQCGEIPFMKLTRPSPITMIKFDCLCNYSYSISLLEFFSLHNMVERFTKRAIKMGKDVSRKEIEDILVKERNYYITDIYKLWDFIIKGHKLVDVLDINISTKCKEHNDLLFMFFCKTCKCHLCNQCMITHSKSHTIIELKNYIDSSLLNQKIKLFEDIKKIRLEENLKIYTATENLLLDTIDLIKSKGKDILALAQIIGIVDAKSSLLSVYKHSCLENGCMCRFFNVLIELCYHIKTPNNYVILENIKQNWNFCLDRQLISHEFKEKVAIMRCIELSKYYMNHLLIQPEVKPTDDDYMDIYERYNKITIAKIKEITCVQSRNYGKHVVKINHVLFLNNNSIVVCGDFQVIKMFSADELRCTMKFKGHEAAVNYMCTLGKDYFVSCGDDNAVIKWEIKSAAMRWELMLKLSSALSNKKVIKKHSARVIQVLSTNDVEFVSLSEDKTIIVWHDEKEIEEFTSFVEPTSTFVAMIYAMNEVITFSKDNIMRFWSIRYLKQLSEKKISNVECGGPNCLRTINDSLLIVGGSNGITIVDLVKNSIIQKVKENELTGISCVYGLSKNTFICGSKDFFIQFKYTYERVHMIKKFPIEHKDRMTCITKGAGNLYYTVSYDSTIKKWRIENE